MELMVGGDEAKPLGGRPMEPEAFTDNENIVSALPVKSHLVSLEAARFSLPTIKRLIPLLQSMQDQATALTEELNILIDGMLLGEVLRKSAILRKTSMGGHFECLLLNPDISE